MPEYARANALDATRKLPRLLQPLFPNILSTKNLKLAFQNWQQALTCRADDKLPFSLRSESLETADFVEKYRIYGADSVGLNRAREPFLSGFTSLLRCRKDPSQP
jgi:hypothetical protein